MTIPVPMERHLQEGHVTMKMLYLVPPHMATKVLKILLLRREWS